MPTEDATARLTAREKEVLRAWLDRKSAKEIALDLGITHHAVEKRLKMARTKLGAGSSLEAARMLAAAEGYGQTGPAAPDLRQDPAPLPSRQYRPVLIGGIAMSLCAVLALALAPASPPAITEIEIDGDLGQLFAHQDANGSGYLEKPESPFVEIAFVDDTGPEPQDGAAVIGGGITPDQIAEFYAAADTDGDGRISLAEFTGWSKARWAEMGIEVKTIVKVLPAAGS